MAIEVKYEVRGTDNDSWFFVLNDPTQGKLASRSGGYTISSGVLIPSELPGVVRYVLGPNILVQITDYVKSINITRGKNRQVDAFDPGLANIVFDNSTRDFDPTYSASPIYGAIKPNRVIAVADEISSLYLGIVQDWNISYDVAGDANASAAAADAFTLFANQTITAGTAIEQLSSDRVAGVLEESSVSWPYYTQSVEDPTVDKVIYTGSQTLGADVISEGTVALDYLQLIELSEPGKFFVDRYGRPNFLGRNTKGWSESIVLFADDGTGIPYSDVTLSYGSEYLFNEVEVSSVITDDNVTVIDTGSQADFGVRNLSRLNLLMSSYQAVDDMATYFAQKYAYPAVRFESLIFVNPIDENPGFSGMELGDIVQVKFTPLGIGDAINQYAEVIGIDHEITVDTRITTLRLDSIQAPAWRLSDPLFGKLSAGNTLAY